MEALLLDCDGVIRHWDVSHFEALATHAGCDVAGLAAIAFEPDLLHAAMCGRITAEAWADAIGAEASIHHGAEADEVARRFLAIGWTIDESVLAVAARVRAAGKQVAILSNASTKLEADLTAEGIVDQVDLVLSSARLGLAKPDPAIYRAAAEALGVAPDACLFVDDQQANVHAAREAGMASEVFMGAGPLAVLCRQAGLLE